MWTEGQYSAEPGTMRYGSQQNGAVSEAFAWYLKTVNSTNVKLQPFKTRYSKAAINPPTSPPPPNQPLPWTERIYAAWVKTCFLKLFRVTWLQLNCNWFVYITHFTLKYGLIFFSLLVIHSGWLGQFFSPPSKNFFFFFNKNKNK